MVRDYPGPSALPGEKVSAGLRGGGGKSFKIEGKSKAQTTRGRKKRDFPGSNTREKKQTP